MDRSNLDFKTAGMLAVKVGGARESYQVARALAQDMSAMAAGFSDVANRAAEELAMIEAKPAGEVIPTDWDEGRFDGDAEDAAKALERRAFDLYDLADGKAGQADTMIATLLGRIEHFQRMHDSYVKRIEEAASLLQDAAELLDSCADM